MCRECARILLALMRSTIVPGLWLNNKRVVPGKGMGNEMSNGHEN